MPTLTQIQDYIKNRRKRIGDNNNIEELKEFVETGLDHEFLIFGEQYGDGSDEEPFHLGFTTKELLKQIEETCANSKATFHLDCTYKIVRYNYPLIVFGFCDIQHQFFPLAFMYTSHEETSDFEWFFRSFKNLCTKLEIEFDPFYIVTDACKAMAAAIDKELPDTTLIMCYFHVKLNIKKKKGKLIPSEEYSTIMKEITALHFTKSVEEYRSLLNTALERWWKKRDLRQFHNYFVKQWINSSFNKWQSFRTDTGMANTNSPIESYNYQIKYSFLKQLRHHMKRYFILIACKLKIKIF